MIPDWVRLMDNKVFHPVKLHFQFTSFKSMDREKNLYKKVKRGRGRKKKRAGRMTTTSTKREMNEKTCCKRHSTKKAKKKHRPNSSLNELRFFSCRGTKTHGKNSFQQSFFLCHHKYCSYDYSANASEGYHGQIDRVRTNPNEKNCELNEQLQ